MITYDSISNDDYSTCAEVVKAYAFTYQTKHREPVPEENIDKQIRFQIGLTFGDIDETLKESLFRMVKHDVDTVIEETDREGSCLEDKKQNHVEWFTKALQDTSIKWDHWDFYKSILTAKKTVESKIAAEKVNKETNAILSRLESPTRPGAWDSRGLVVGDVQAGKTSNYVGLLAKAVDVGYKVIIVLAGSTDDLRVQTQERIDDGLLGYRTNKNGDNGVVQKCKGKAIQTKTSCDPKGDYKKNPVFSSIVGDDCVLYVVKKNGSVLRNILSDLFKQIAINSSNLIEDIPVLVIDDEADYASPNTNAPKIDPLTLEKIDAEDLNPTTINRYIRAILSCFEKSAYIGYTATPYANIFELPDHGKETIVHDKRLDREIRIGEDLFPRNFIFKMAAPLNYIGIERVFGIEEDGSDSLPVIIKTNEKFPNDFVEIETGSKRKIVKTILKDNPESLKYAINCFILASVVKDIRKTKVIHNTMLVHIDRLTSSHSEIRGWVSSYLDYLKGLFTIETSRIQKKYLDSLKNLWKEEFDRKFDSIYEKSGSSSSLYPIKWADIEMRVPTLISKLIHRTVNGKTLDALDYGNHKEGLNVIAIGGDKLARGLTLEGLTISYFLRNAGTYDTLTQMGRWFGYRDGYLDVCRVFTMAKTYNNFREIAAAVHDIYQQFDDLCKQDNRTPMDYGLRVLTDPRSKLLITARNKSKGAIKHAISFSGSPVPTAYLPTDSEVISRNFEIMKNFIGVLNKPTGIASSVRSGDSGSDYYWSNVSSNVVIENFLKSSYVVDKQNTWFTLPEIASFVESMNTKHNEITDWTVVLVNGSDKSIGPVSFGEYGEYEVYASERKLEPMEDNQGFYELNRRRIASGSDEAFDLSSQRYQAALIATNEERQKKNKGNTKTPNSHYIRLNRNSKSALLLLYPLHLKYDNESFIDGIVPGFMISFPELGYREMDMSFWANVVYAQNGKTASQTVHANEVDDD